MLQLIDAQKFVDAYSSDAIAERIERAAHADCEWKI